MLDMLSIPANRLDPVNSLDSTYLAQRQLSCIGLCLLTLTLLVLLWVLVQWFFVRPDSIQTDWMAWRQTDTQSIALNFLYRDFNIFYPRVNWGGEGPGFVETEFQIYTALCAALMHFFGEGVWAGQLISLVAVLISLFILAWHTAKRFGFWPAFIVVLILLSSRPFIFLSTSIQPDALSLMFYIASWGTFLSYLETAKTKFLVLSCISLLVAAWIKPTALHLGIAQGVLVLFYRPKFLGKAQLWMGWSVILLGVGLVLIHGKQIFLEYGNTFGLLSGGDSKTPTAELLTKAWVWQSLFRQVLTWGIGIWGFAALVFLLLRGELDGVIFSLIIAISLILVVSLRYSHGDYGPHYHQWWLVLVAWVIVKALFVLKKDLIWFFETVEKKGRFNNRFMNKLQPGAAASIVFGLILFMVVLVSARQYYYHQQERLGLVNHEPQVAEIGQQLLNHLWELSPPSGFAETGYPLIIVRSLAESYDYLWQTVNNFEDPRIFYIARVKGWVLAKDDDLSQISNLIDQGAEYYVEPRGATNSEAVENWLNKEALIIFSGEAGRIFKLNLGNSK